MNIKTNRLIVLVELEDGNLHQVIMVKSQEQAIKAVLKSMATVQLVSEPVGLKIEK